MLISSWFHSLRPSASRTPARRARQRPWLEALEDRSLMNAALSISNPSWSYATQEGDSGTVQAVFVVRLSEPTTQTVTVNFATADGTAKAKSDYMPTSGTLTFASGETEKLITVLVKGDKRVEDDENYTVNLSAAIGAVIEKAIAEGRIINDDYLGDHCHRRDC